MSPKKQIRLPEIRLLKHRQEAVLDSLSRGEIERVRFDQKWAVDQVVRFGLETGILQPAEPVSELREVPGLSTILIENTSAETQTGGQSQVDDLYPGLVCDSQKQLVHGIDSQACRTCSRKIGSTF